MHSIANGSAAAVGLIGAASPPITDEVPTTPTFLAPAARLVAEVTTETPRRLVVRLLGGEELELGDFDDRDDAIEAAKELVGRFKSAESAGEWPEVDGRFLRPASIASVDVLIKD